MSKILAIKSVKGKLNGKPYVLVTTAAKDHWVPYGMWLNNASEVLETYIGGNFEGQYFQKGDVMINGQECTNDDIILSSFSASKDATVLALQAAVADDKKSQEMRDAMAYQQRLRAQRNVKVDPIKTA